MDTPDTIAIAAVLAALGAGVVALAALIVSYKALKEARRAADAQENAVAISERDAKQRAADRDLSEGPGFETVSGYVIDRTAHAELRIVSGPGRVVLDVRADAPWCSGISADGEGPVGSITYPPMHPGETFRLTAHLRSDPWDGRSNVILPLIINVESREDPPRTWRRDVQVELKPGPMVAWA